MAGLLTRALARSRERLSGALARLTSGSAFDAAALESLEEALIAADVGPTTVAELIDQLRKESTLKANGGAATVLAAAMTEILDGVEGADPEAMLGQGTRVWLLVGVNGTGKTTTAAKLASRFTVAGHSVILGAADTFRAAAAEQLRVWGGRLEVPVVAHRAGGDPAAVVYDTCEAALARQHDLALIDTAGRLHTHDNLMAELDKIRRVAGKVIQGAPHEVLLVLDATTGQNGLRQAEQFVTHAGVTGLVLAKLDGTARGGVALAIARSMGLPVRYVGVGESATDMQRFDAAAYVDGLLGSNGA